MRLCFIMGLVLLNVVACRAQTGQWSYPINISKTPGYTSQQSIAIDASGGLHVTFLDDSTGNPRVYYTNNTGSSWTTPVDIQGPYNSGYASQIGFLSSGKKFAIYTAKDPNGSAQVWYREYVSGTWSTPQRVSSGSSSAFFARGAVTVDANDTIHIGYLDLVLNNTYQIRHAYKPASGGWQLNPNLVHPVGDYQGNCGIITTGSGTDVKVHFVVQSGAGVSDWRIYYRRWNGTSWSVVNNLTASIPAAAGTPVIRVQPSGRLVTAYSSSYWGNWDPVYQYSDDNGATWSAPYDVMTPGDTEISRAVDLACDAQGDVIIAWEQLSSPTIVMTRRLHNGAWQLIQNVGTGFTGVGPRLAVQNNTLVMSLMSSMEEFKGYYWDIFYTDLNGNPDPTPPGSPTNAGITPSNGKNTLIWVQPADPDVQGAVIRWSTTGYPATKDEGSLAAQVAGGPGSYSSFVHTGLTNGTRYYYSIFAYDRLPNYSAPVKISAVPTAPVYQNLLSNGMMDLFTGGVANNWNPYKVNDNGQISFQQDPVNFDITPYSQAIYGIDSSGLPASSVAAAGLYRQMTVTPGKHYMFVGYQDIYNSGFSAAGYRYIHNFGINTSGGTAPGTPNENGTIGEAKWLPSGMAFWNKDSGGASTIGGFHRCMSAFTADNTSISLWSGVSIRTAGGIDPTQTRFNIDSNYLFEFDNTVNGTGSLINGGFETFVNLQNGGGGEAPDTIPDSWIPCGGGIGQLQHIWTDAYGARTGSYGVRMWNRRGVNSYGLMQRISTKPGTQITFGCYAQGSAYCSASIGIDPNGGTDINSPGIVWSSTQSTAWTYISRTATSTGPTATLFLRNLFVADIGQSHVAMFDDATASWTKGGDTTPPSNPVSCVDLNGSTNAVWQGTVGDPYFSWSGASDQESGIAGYYVYFSNSPTGTSTTFVTSASYSPGTTVPGTSYLRVRAQNGAGMQADIWKTIYEFKFDPTPPAAVVVTDTGTYTSSLTNLSGYWTSSSDNESGILRYEYGIGTAPGLVDVTNWIQNNTSTSAGQTGLSLIRGTKYYLTARAVNAAGITGPASSSDGIWCAQLPISIGEAKSYPDGTPVILTGRKVSGVFLNDYWIIDPDRTGGIRIEGNSSSLAEGDTVNVGGLLGQIGGERVLQDAELNPQ